MPRATVATIKAVGRSAGSGDTSTISGPTSSNGVGPMLTGGTIAEAMIVTTVTASHLTTIVIR